LANQNDKIGKWSLYGTIGGAFILGSLYTIVDKGIKAYIVDWIPLVTSIIIFLFAMFIIGLFPEKWIPCITVLFILAFIFYMHRSWVFTIIVAVLLGIYYLVNKTVKNERISKWIHIILFIGFLLVWTLLY